MQAALTEEMRGEIDELCRLLKGNLQKVVHHGKRADSIVKSMLCILAKAVESVAWRM